MRINYGLGDTKFPAAWLPNDSIRWPPKLIARLAIDFRWRDEERSRPQDPIANFCLLETGETTSTCSHHSEMPHFISVIGSLIFRNSELQNFSYPLWRWPIFCFNFLRIFGQITFPHSASDRLSPTHTHTHSQNFGESGAKAFGENHPHWKCFAAMSKTSAKCNRTESQR